MAGFGPLATSLGFFLRGQQQGQQAQDLEALKAQILRRQALASTKQILQMPDGTFKIVDLADPNVAGSNIGTPTDIAGELKAFADSGAVPKELQSLTQVAIKSGNRDLQSSIYSTLLKRISTAPKGASGGGKDPVVIDQAMSDNGLDDPSQVSNQQYLDAWKKVQAYKSNLIAGRTPAQIVQMPGMDPEGRPIQIPYRVPKRGGEATPVMAAPTSAGAGPTQLIGRKTSGTETKMIENIEATLPQIEDLRANLKALGPEKWNRSVVIRQLDYQKAKHLNILPADPDLAKVMSQAIQVETQIKSALASAAGIRAINFINQSAGHIPTGFGDYNSMLANIDVLLAPNGPYRAMLRASGVPTAAGAASAGGSSDLPPASMIPEGTKLKFSNGKTYQNINGAVSEVAP